jgi:hypothetical protein
VIQADIKEVLAENRRLKRGLLEIACDHAEPNNEYQGPENPGDGCLGCIARKVLRVPSTWRKGMPLPPTKASKK